MPGLQPHQDAYGLELWHYHTGAHTLDIIERDDGFVEASSLDSYFAGFDDWPECERSAIAHAHGRVLDVGQGAGRVCLHLQNRGLDVLGIDVSPLALKTAKSRGVKKVKLLSITEVTSGLGTFDTIVMLGNNFGLFGTPRRARWLLRRFRNIKSSDAVLIVGTNNVDCQAVPDYHRQYHQRNRERGRLPGQVRLRVRHLLYATPWFDYLMVSPDEMREILDGTGWRIREFYMSEGQCYTAVIEKGV